MFWLTACLLLAVGDNELPRNIQPPNARQGPMKRAVRHLLALTIAMVLAPPVGAQDAAPGLAPPSFSGVAWAGPTASPSALAGKTVVVVTYVTWCPKCNAWSGNMLTEIKDAIADKPVVVYAISTDTPPAEAVQYMQTRGFIGPNIFHGHDPTIAKRFGFQSQFFNYAVINPEGKVARSGTAGGQIGDGKMPEYDVARELMGVQDFGKFRFLKPEMSADLKNRLWLVELGASKALNRDLKKMEKGLTTEDRDLLRTTVKEFVAAEVMSLDELSQSDEVGDKLAALDKAIFLNTQFASTPEGKRAKEVLAELNGDKTLKQESLAKKQYEKTMQIADQDKRARALDLLGKKFADTQFGKHASEAAQATTR